MNLESAPGLVDSHCHLNFDIFDQDRDSIVDRARNNGVDRICIPGVDLPTSRSAVKFANEFPEVYAAVGVHPNSGNTWTDSSLSEISELAGGDKVVAIGEIGLDYYRDRTPKKQQQAILWQQLELATTLELPVIIHNRLAAQDMLEILSEWHNDLVARGLKLANTPGVLHSYSGDIKFASELINKKFKIGINGSVTFHNARELQSVVSSLQLQDLLVETDAPFLTPHPFRGQRNEPANVRIVAGKIAEIKSDPIGKVINITTAGADMLFGWRKIP